MSASEDLTRISDTSSEKKGRFKVKNVKPNGESQDLSIQSVKGDSSHSLGELQRSSILTGTVISSLLAPTKQADGIAGAVGITSRAPLQPVNSLGPQQQNTVPAVSLNVTGQLQGQGPGQIMALNYPTEKEILTVAGSSCGASPNSKATVPTPSSATATAPPVIPKKSRFTVKTIPVVEDEPIEVFKGDGSNQGHGHGQGHHIIQGQGQGQWMHPPGLTHMTNINGENQMLHRLEQLFEMNAQMLSRVIDATRLSQRGESLSNSVGVSVSGDKQHYYQSHSSTGSSGTFLQPQSTTPTPVPVPVPSPTPGQKVLMQGQSPTGGSSPQLVSSPIEGQSNRLGQAQGQGQGLSQNQGKVGPGQFSNTHSNSNISLRGQSPPLVTASVTKRPTSAGSTRQPMSISTASQQTQFQSYIHLSQNPGQDSGSIFNVTSPTVTPPIPPSSSFLQRPSSTVTSPNISSVANSSVNHSNGGIVNNSSASGTASSNSSGSCALISNCSTVIYGNSGNNSSSSSNSTNMVFPSSSGSSTGGIAGNGQGLSSGSGSGLGSGSGTGVISPILASSPLLGSGPMGANSGTGVGAGQGVGGTGAALSQGQGHGYGVDGRGIPGQGYGGSSSSGLSSGGIMSSNEKDKSSAFGKLFHYMNEMKKELETAQKQRREGQLETQRLREKCQQLDDRLEMEHSKSAALEDRLERGKSAQRSLRSQVEAQAAQIEALIEALAQSTLEK